MHFGKTITSLFAIILMFSLFSCESNSSESVIGGLYGDVRWNYEFESYTDYLEFYNIFKDYNEERYWVPSSDSNYFDVIYNFDTYPVTLIDAKESRYDIDFWFQTMYATLSNDIFEIVFTINCLNESDFTNNASLETNLVINDETYDVSVIYNSDIAIAYGTIQLVETFKEELILDDYLDEIVNLFETSFTDVFK